MGMTMKLVKKDILHLTYSLRNVLVMWVILCTCLPVANLGFAVVMPALGAYITFNSMRAYEERNKGDLLTSMLPVTRTAMCNAQYIQVLLYSIGGIILSSIGLGFKQVVEGVHIQIVPIATVMLAMALIYTGIIVPFIIYFGVVKSKYMLMITYIVIFIGAFSISRDGTAYMLNAIEKINSSISVIMLIAIGIWAISYFITLNIFKNKDYK